MTDRKLPSGWWFMPCFLGGVYLWVEFFSRVLS